MGNRDLPIAPEASKSKVRRGTGAEAGRRRRSKRAPNLSESTGKIGQELPSNQPAPLVPTYPEDLLPHGRANEPRSNVPRSSEPRSSEPRSSESRSNAP